MYALRSYKGWFYSLELLDLRTFEVFQGLHSRPILNHAFDFWLAEKYFEPFWKSDPAKIGPAGPVPLPLHCIKMWLLVRIQNKDSSLIGCKYTNSGLDY